MRHVNPDGSVVEYYINGDEQFHYLSDIDRTTLLERNGNTIMPLMRNGQKMLLTEANLTKLRAENPSIELPVSPIAGKVNRMAALDANGRTKYPTEGEVRACVILLEYADTPFSSPDPQKQFDRLCNEKGYSDYNSFGSAKDYFEACSGGKFSPTFDVYGPVKLQYEAKWYVGDDDPSLPGYHHNARFGCAIKEALEYLDPDVDFSIYDYDDDGEIDNIFFFYSGYGQADTANPLLIWPHQTSYWRYTTLYGGTLGLDRLWVDGKEMVSYACSNELNGSPKIAAEDRPWIDGIGAFCHEYGHVLGLPDLYDTMTASSSSVGQTPTPGTYTVMDRGSYNYLSTRPPLFSAYEKWLCKWIEYTESTSLTDGDEITLHAQTSPEANAVRLRIPRPGTNRFYPEYYVLECRNSDSWDESLDEHGMLIWHINFNANAWENNQVNVNNNPLVGLVTINSKGTSKVWPGSDGTGSYLSPSSAQLTSSTTKKPLNVTLTNIFYDYDDPEADKVTFEYNKYQENSLTTALHAYSVENAATNSIKLTWDAVPDASNYMLTLSRRTSTSEFTVAGLDKKMVGNVTSYTVDNLTAAQMKQTFTAKICVVAGLPSSQTTTLSFIPENLTSDSGVDGIDADALAIYGGKGEIIAPEGARAYNLSGIETGLTNLSAGVYIVVTPKATAKVVVR